MILTQNTKKAEGKRMGGCIAQWGNYTGKEQKPTEKIQINWNMKWKPEGNGVEDGRGQ